VLTLDQIGISDADWNQMLATGCVAIMFLLKQNQLLENRNYTYHLEVEGLKAELERLKQLELEVAELRERLGAEFTELFQTTILRPHVRRSVSRRAANEVVSRAIKDTGEDCCRQKRLTL
jgi:hypothetical protein